MHKLGPDDRGVFLVKTQGSEHTWTITDEGVTVQRKSLRPSHPSMQGFPEAPYEANVHTWPVVGRVFLNIIDGGAVPWTQSSTIESIEKIEVS